MLNALTVLAIVTLALQVAGCGDSGTSSTGRWVLDAAEPPPARLSQVGIFGDISGRIPYQDVLRYVPRHELYSNGLEKERHLYLPDEKRIGVADGAPWDFPVGTVLSKTFVYEGNPVETRLLFQTAGGWDYAIYRWRPDGSEAERLDDNWAELTLNLGSGEVTHTLPSRLDCRTCHETHQAVAGVPVLGISSIQTSEDLIEAGAFLESPSLQEVEGRTEHETAALGYFIGNCTSCHNGGDAINSAFSLYPEDAVANTVNRPTETETGQGLRVVPGAPDQSVLFITVVEAGSLDYRGPFKRMPPLGLSRVDPEVETILVSWIEKL